jgi:hypothetical protein
MSTKTDNEFWLATQFAEAHNRLFKTDFTVDRSNREKDSADAFLVSASAKSRIGLQISKVTSQDRMKEESIQTKLRRKISEDLMQKGLSDCHVWVEIGRPPEKADFQEWQSFITALVLEHYHKPGKKIIVPLPQTELPEETTFFQVWISKGALRDGYKHLVIVDFGLVKELLMPDVGIQMALDKKINMHYSDSGNLWLLLHPGEGAYATELSEVRSARINGAEKFAQVWWVYPQRDRETEICRISTSNGTV